MNQDQQRDAFEAWLRKNHPNHSLEYVNGRYTYSPPQRLWLAYQAALASPEVQALREDAERLDFITAPESAWFVQWEKRSGKQVRFRMIDDGEVFGKWHDTARQAIDAAMEKT